MARDRDRDRDEERKSKKLKFDENKLVPEGWIDCPNFGHEVAMIVPSKVPLEKTYNDIIDPEKRYSFRKLFDCLDVEIGMVVDLTNTFRYYSPNDIKKDGAVKYLKIRCQGRDAVPDDDAVNSFVYEVEQFMIDQRDGQTNKRVLVHCTHGHNRTGYMIVHYLMRTQQVGSVTDAILRFSNARPPGIYKQDYIDELYAFYNETKPDSVLYPSTPLWKKSSSEFDVNNGRVEGVVMMSNDDVLGDKVNEKREVELRGLCFDLLRLPKGGCLQFPGSHPVSLDRENLQLLRRSYYYATWKADGTRYMLLILSNENCFLIDRCFHFRRVQLRFPRRDIDGLHHCTLLDGEMVIDSVNGKQERRYLIYDMIAINGESIVQRPFCERWKLIDIEVVRPRNTERQSVMQKHPENCYRYDLELFRVRRKDFWLLSTVQKLLNKVIPAISHKSDGLIFQGWDDPYVPRTHEGLLKWKYPEMNSVDFLFEVGNDDVQNLYLTDRGRKRLLNDNNRVVFGDGFDSPSTYSGKIIECSWDSEENAWVCMRVRVDKSTPNGYYTYLKVMKSINDNITQEVLLNEINQIVRLPMYADRIQAEIAQATRK
ncbi:hypothetical protein vseg_006106 [Gypsophila vaccaria]